MRPLILGRCQIAYFGIAADAELRTAAQDGRPPKLLGVAGDRRFTEQGGTLELAHVRHPAPSTSG